MKFDYVDDKYGYSYDYVGDRPVIDDLIDNFTLDEIIKAVSVEKIESHLRKMKLRKIKNKM